jgi:hypothetical protein
MIHALTTAAAVAFVLAVVAKFEFLRSRRIAAGRA